MRSRTGLAAAILVLLAVPLAVVTSNVFGNEWAETAVHFSVGIGFLLFAAAVFDFGLPRWVNVIGAAAGAAFGGIFLLQGISELVDIPGLTYLAFDVLGHQVERLLPDLIFIWFVALLLAGSSGLSRYVGWIVMPIVIGLELAIAIGTVAGIEVPFIKLAFMLPLVWLIFESVERPSTAQPVATYRRNGHQEAVSA